MISNYKKQTYVTGLQKAYSVLNNVTKDAMAREDVTSFSDTQLMKTWENSSQDANAFVSELKTYLPNSELTTLPSGYDGPLALLYGYKETGKIYTNYLFYTGGGMLIDDKPTCMISADSIMYCFGKSTNYIPGNNASEDYRCPVYATAQSCLQSILVDVNAFKKPNELGRDIFYFSVGYKSGIVLPSVSQSINKNIAKQQANCVSASDPTACFNSVEKAWNDMYEQMVNSNVYCFNTDPKRKRTGTNVGCADKIIKDGWKMNY